jgi:hypothetical protein
MATLRKPRNSKRLSLNMLMEMQKILPLRCKMTEQPIVDESELVREFYRREEEYLLEGDDMNVSE